MLPGKFRQISTFLNKNSVIYFTKNIVYRLEKDYPISKIQIAERQDSMSNFLFKVPAGLRPAGTKPLRHSLYGNMNTSDVIGSIRIIQIIYIGKNSKPVPYPIHCKIYSFNLL